MPSTTTSYITTILTFSSCTSRSKTRKTFAFKNDLQLLCELYRDSERSDLKDIRIKEVDREYCVAKKVTGFTLEELTTRFWVNEFEDDAAEAVFGDGEVDWL